MGMVQRSGVREEVWKNKGFMRSPSWNDSSQIYSRYVSITSNSTII